MNKRTEHALTSANVEIGQRYRGMNGHILTVIRIDGPAGKPARIVVRNETDRFEGAFLDYDFAARIARGTLTPITDQDTDPAIVAEAVTALRCFGADLTLADAMKLLPMWHYANRLTAAERAEVLKSFTDGGAR